MRADRVPRVVRVRPALDDDRVGWRYGCRRDPWHVHVQEAQDVGVSRGTQVIADVQGMTRADVIAARPELEEADRVLVTQLPEQVRRARVDSRRRRDEDWETRTG